MPYEVRVNPVFENDRKQFLKNRPLAEKDIKAALESFAENPRQGDRIPGIGALEIRKARWPLKSYRIGSSAGLRFIYVVQEKEQTLLPITLWQKKDLTDETKVLAYVKTRLKQTIDQLKSPAPPDAEE